MLDMFRTMISTIDAHIAAVLTGAQFYEFSPDFERLGATEIQEFMIACSYKDTFLYPQAALIESSSSTPYSPQYDRVYAPIAELSERPLYGFCNALLVPALFQKITGISVDELRRQMILDVGAGSGGLEHFFLAHDVPADHVTALDPSKGSLELLFKMGITSERGTLQRGLFEQKSFSLIFLSYFIDYDTNQKETLRGTLEAVRSGGKIILEARFPVTLKVPKSDETLVSGPFSTIDIPRILSYMESVSDRKILLERIGTGHRYTYASKGLVRYNSTFLVFKIG